MKVALIGNMNNNNFALLRYFRNLGVDAHLLLYSNDGRADLGHFKPECDTWDIEKWQPYIHRTCIPNVPFAALEFPLSWLVSFVTIILYCLRLRSDWFFPVSRSQIIKTYSGYDKYIASGITPATFSRVNLKLDIFYPYCCGVEFLSHIEFFNSLSNKYFLRRCLVSIVRNTQIEGVRKARHVLNFDMGTTRDVLNAIGIHPIELAIPMVFDNEIMPEIIQNKEISDIASVFERSHFTVMHQARLIWKNPGHLTKEEWRNENKNNNWVIHAFAQFIKLRPNLNPILAIVEYGPDVNEAKQLVKDLKLNKNVIFLPIMDRKDLMWLISRSSVCVGEFYEVSNVIWGGTGWEALASGKPLIQGFNFQFEEFELFYGYPPPPMLPVRQKEDILIHFLHMADNPGKLAEIGSAAKSWFNCYNGVGLAKQWLELLMVADCNEQK